MRPTCSPVCGAGPVAAELVVAAHTVESVRVSSRQGDLWGDLRFPRNEGGVHLVIQDGRPNLYPGLPACVEYDGYDGHYHFETHVTGVSSSLVQVARPALIHRDGRRQTPRVVLLPEAGARLRLTRHVGGGACRIHDLSLGGLRFEEAETDAPMGIGEATLAVLEFADHRALDVTIEVRHAEVSGLRRRVGARFVSLSAPAQAALAAFLVESL